MALMRRTRHWTRWDCFHLRPVRSVRSICFDSFSVCRGDPLHPVSLEQVLQADRQLWSIMSQAVRKGIAVRGDGTYPLEGAFKDAKCDPLKSIFAHAASASSPQCWCKEAVGSFTWQLITSAVNPWHAA
eukprot:5983759-Amphidinium_carterae.1